MEKTIKKHQFTFLDSEDMEAEDSSPIEDTRFNQNPHKGKQKSKP